jgi:hypothetical protein
MAPGTTDRAASDLAEHETRLAMTTSPESVH